MPRVFSGVVLPVLLGAASGSCRAPDRPAADARAGSAVSATPASFEAKTAPTEETAPAKGTFNGRVELGSGLKLHLHCAGEGSPLVVFESGLGMGAQAWAGILPAVARVTRACAYDRAGRGSSDPAKRPHSNRQMAAELHELLERAGQTSPYVLVGHSMGGTNVQLFLAQHSADVAGMVLIDSSPEPPPIEELPPASVAEFARSIELMEGLDVPTYLAGFVDLRESKRSLGERPLAILVAGRALPDPVISPEQAQRMLRARQRAQESLRDLSRNSALVSVKNSAHHIPQEDPELVSRVVTSVVDAARSGARLSLPDSSP